jgi:hypothetical protein
MVVSMLKSTEITGGDNYRNGTAPKTISLEVFGEPHIRRMQVCKYLDGCVVVTVLYQDGSDEKHVQAGLAEQQSADLIAFLNDTETKPTGNQQ